jgi:glycosyltransferase involved in cell wall biosynthesis
MKSEKELAIGFRSAAEARACYARFDRGVFVSRGVLEAFRNYCPLAQMQVLYNTNESDKILNMAAESTQLPGNGVRWCGMGKLVENKCFDRMLRIQKRLLDEGYRVHFLALGEGDQRPKLEQYVRDNGMDQHVTFLGYQTNPYKYVAKCDLFVCASFAEGFSTAATEALIVGTPVCTVEVSGMKEMLGDHNEWGIVTENDENALYEGIKRLLDNPALLAHYKEKAAERGKTFSTENTVNAVQDMLRNL